MEVTGYKLMQALKEAAFAKETAEQVFDDSLWKFEGEQKISPEVAMEAYKVAETRFATLQAAQGVYNQSIFITISGKNIPLALAVKLVGGAGRMEKKWREAAKIKTDKHSLFDDRQYRKRDEGTEYAKKTISPKDAAEQAKKAAKYASALREAIQVANATVKDFTDLKPEHFE